MTAKEGKQEMQRIDLQKLSLSNLYQLKKQFDNEISICQESLQNLRIAHSKYNDSKECVEKMQSDETGDEILVPLTGSMYVPGKITDKAKVLVDIGTGYYVNMDISDAKEYFKRRVNFLSKELDTIQAGVSEKNKIRDSIIDMIEINVQAQLQAQQRSAQQTVGDS